MQTTVEKRYKHFKVTDLDIMYVGGFHDQITYGGQDLVTETDETIEVLIREQATGKTIERLTCLKRNIASYKYRDRMVKVEDKTPLPIEVADAPTD